MADIRATSIHWIANKHALAGDYVLYRKAFELNNFKKAELTVFCNSICAVYLNGLPVIKTAPSLESNGHYYEVTDVSDFLMPGENVLAVMLYCNGADGVLPCSCLSVEIEADGENALYSNGSFLTTKHSGLKSCCYDSRSPETEFEYPDYDDFNWEQSVELETDVKTPFYEAAVLDEQPVKPKSIKKDGKTLSVDFGKCRNGCLYLEAEGNEGAEIDIELFDGANTTDLKWILANGFNTFVSFIPMKIGSCKITPKGTAVADSDSITLLTTEK